MLRHFPSAKTDDMNSYVAPAIKQNPETIKIHFFFLQNNLHVLQTTLKTTKSN